MHVRMLVCVRRVGPKFERAPLRAGARLDMGDELAALVALGELAGAARPRRAPRRRPPPAADAPVLGAPAEAPAAIVPADQDGLEVDALAELAQAPPRRYEQRSWQLLQHARDVRGQKRARLAASSEKERREKADGKLAEVCMNFPMVASALNIPITRPAMNEDRARVLARLAFGPSFRGDVRGRLTQARAASVVGRAVSATQAACVDRLLGHAPNAEDAPPLFIRIISWQWDESNQRCRAMLQRRFPGEKKSFGQTALCVMQQCGQVSTFEVRGAGHAGSVVEQEPMFVRGKVLESQSAAALLASVLPSYPLDVESLEAVCNAAYGCDVLCLAFCLDRAANNFKALSWWYKLLEGGAMPINAVPFIEPCAAHGVALVKSRLCLDNAMYPMASVFSSLMRGWRFASALRDSVIIIVGANLVIERSEMPPEVEQHSQRLIEVLWGEGADSPMLYTTNAQGQRVPTTFHEELKQLASVCKLGLGVDVSQLTHHCWVVAGSDAHKAGAAVGAPCCQSRQEAVEKVVAAFANVVLHRPWTRSCQSRWTAVVGLLRKLCVGFSCAGLLPAAVVHLRAHWQLSDSVSLEAELARAIAADAGDFASKNKLKLLRVAKRFGDDGALLHLGVEVSVITKVDAILTDILGGGADKMRANLASLVDENDSVVARSEQRLLRLVEDWSGESWPLLQAFNCNFERRDHKMVARAAVLQEIAGLFDHFSQRLRHPPYSLFKLVDPAVPVGRRREVAGDFFGRPWHCQSLACRRILGLCPTVHDVEARAGFIMRSIAEGGQISVDFTERTHAMFRTDIATSGRGANFTKSANKTMLQQARAAHVERTSVDPATGKRPGGRLAIGARTG